MNVSKRYHKTTSLLILALLLASISYFLQTTHHLIEDFSCRIKIFLSEIYYDGKVRDMDISPEKTFTIFPLQLEGEQDAREPRENEFIIEIG